MILQELNALSDLIIEELRRELKDQGHNMTGALSRSIKIRTVAGRDGISLIGSFLRYGASIDQGIKPDKIPFTIGSGKKSSEYIKGLIRFVKRRRIATNDKKAKQIAFAIAITAKIKREGHPTKGSFSRTITKNGRRLGWMTGTLERNEEEIGELLQDIFNNEISVNIDNLLKNIE